MLPSASPSLLPLIISPRKQLVILMAANGFNAKQTAQYLMLSEDTIDTYRKELMRKTQSPNMISMVVKAIRWGWIQ